MSKKNRHIPIKCRGLREVHYSTLKPFQGGLKEMSPESADKLKSSILKWGWRFPVFAWRDGDTDWIHDGHGRLLVLRALVDEGYTIGRIPVVDIEAKDRKEAAELLLALNSRYQKITDEGLYGFMTEFEIDPVDLEGFDLPEIDMEEFREGYFEDGVKADVKEDKKNYSTKYEVVVECKNEEEQQVAYNLLMKRGYKCRVLTL